jgi:hypothetical protein
MVRKIRIHSLGKEIDSHLRLMIMNSQPAVHRFTVRPHLPQRCNVINGLLAAGRLPAERP